MRYVVGAWHYWGHKSARPHLGVAYFVRTHCKLVKNSAKVVKRGGRKAQIALLESINLTGQHFYLIPRDTSTPLPLSSL